MNKRTIAIIAVVIIAIVLIGEIYVYTFEPDSKYDINVSMSDNGLNYTIRSDIASTYNVVISDNGDFTKTEEYYAYYDESYKSPFKYSDVRYYLDQLDLILQKSNIHIKIMNAEQLSSVLNSNISDNACNNALIVITGSLPDLVYTGNSSDTIIEWIEHGGRLYWAGNVIGEYSSTYDTLNYIQDSSILFLGSDCINRTIQNAYSKIASNAYCSALHLQSNDILFSIDTSKIVDRDLLITGYTNNNCASISLIECGNGMICLIGGYLTSHQRMDLAQVLSSQICYQSKIIEHISGDVIRQTVSGTAKFDVSDSYYSVYIYLGGDFTEYCRDSYYSGKTKI